MNNKKGFTLMEVLTVVIIIGILAALSIPNLIGYMRDARNDRAKSNLYMIAQGYKNFRNDFNWVNINPWGPLVRQNLADDLQTQTCPLNSLIGTDATVNANVLIQCAYINNIDFNRLRYNFYLGDGDGRCNQCPNIPTTSLACMVGNDGAPYTENYCAYIDRDNTLHETAH